MFAKVAAAAIVTIAMSTPAWAAQRSNLETFRDVQQQVLRYPNFTVFDSVHAVVDGGVVRLTGKVTMPYKRNDIGQRVERVAGVSTVINDIEVLPVSQFDDDLRIGIARAIYGNSNFWRYGSMVNPPIHIVVERGRVTLEGVVNSEVDRMLARSIASSFQAFSVTNNLRTDEEVRQEMEKL
jgi:hyperosmotically inducible protein